VSGTGSGAFLADEAKPAGIYAHIGGSLVLGADKKTGIPGGEGKSTGFSDPVSLGGGDLAFHGSGERGQSGIYTIQQNK